MLVPNTFTIVLNVIFLPFGILIEQKFCMALFVYFTVKVVAYTQALPAILPTSLL